MSVWRILLLAETTTVGMLIAQIVALPLFILAAFTSGRGDTVWALEFFIVLPVILYICTGYVGKFETIAPEDTVGSTRMLSYAAHAVAIIGMWQFFYIKVILLTGSFAGFRGLIITSPQGDLVLSFLAVGVGLLIVRNHSRREIAATKE